jgi:stage II sporulation protein D
MIYNIYNGFSVKTYEDIVVGYSLQDFIVAEGKICGAVISKPLDAKNIRVIVKTNGFEDVFHSCVELTSDNSFTVSYNENIDHYNAGDHVVFDCNSEMLQESRVTVQADNYGSIRVLNVNRSQGNPTYEGKMEISLFEQGLVLVNDVDIEDYLKKVVPSEMPASFGVEALKVQAVCARSYAYKQLTNSYYSMYGAHVDDSTLFQVYNNTDEKDESNLAIKQTRGQVLTYDGDVVQTYYYSTSCGATTDVSLWGSDPASYPYFKSIAVSKDEKEVDLSDEGAFEAFITSKNENDYDASCALYRWEMFSSCEQLSKNFNAKIYERYCAVPAKILTQNVNGDFESKKVTTVGTITDITVNKRTSGGAITSLTVSGTKATVRIDSESCIRSLFGDTSITMTTNTGTTVMASLPSTFCIFRGTYSSGKLTGFKITGGGYGHGIGMSQNAVNTMTKNSMTYEKILQFFYPGTELTTFSS